LRASDQSEKKSISAKEALLMATGTAPALDPKVETKNESTETQQAQPLSLKQRMGRLLTEIFQGREEYLGWRQ
jgi:hypothetical protein